MKTFFSSFYHIGLITFFPIAGIAAVEYVADTYVFPKDKNGNLIKQEKKENTLPCADGALQEVLYTCFSVHTSVS